jgi:hypothetical protein
LIFAILSSLVNFVFECEVALPLARVQATGGTTSSPTARPARPGTVLKSVSVVTIRCDLSALIPMAAAEPNASPILQHPVTYVSANVSAKLSTSAAPNAKLAEWRQHAAGTPQRDTRYAALANQAGVPPPKRRLIARPKRLVSSVSGFSPTACVQCVRHA